MEKLIVPLFGKIENKHLSRCFHAEHPWGPEQLKQKVHYLPIADIRVLTLRFPTPDYNKHYKSKVNHNTPTCNE
jgi:secreted Zn-dependent insulinase-like peptidase